MAAKKERRVALALDLVSAHNEPTLCQYPEPTLTSIEYGFDHIGYEAARMLGSLLQGKKLDQKTILVPPREIVIRRSSDFIFIDDQVVTAAMQFISQNAHRPITVDSVLHVVSVSRRTLEQRFAQHVGHSVAAETRRVRIDHAKRLLASSEMKVGKIARVTGFGTSHQLARVFQRELKLSPNEYRKQFIDRK